MLSRVFHKSLSFLSLAPCILSYHLDNTLSKKYIQKYNLTILLSYFLSEWKASGYSEVNILLQFYKIAYFLMFIHITA